MDWNAVKEKYPKAWAAFNAWRETIYPGEFYFYNSQGALVGDISYTAYQFSLHFPTRDLYDFFDAKGIRIVIEYVGDWGFVICVKHDSYMMNPDIISERMVGTRTEAESAAFEKAFSILETMP